MPAQFCPQRQSICTLRLSAFRLNFYISLDFYISLLVSALMYQLLLSAFCYQHMLSAFWYQLFGVSFLV